MSMAAERDGWLPVVMRIGAHVYQTFVVLIFANISLKYVTVHEQSGHNALEPLPQL